MVVALGLIDRLTAQIVELEEELCADGAAHAYAPLLMTIPGIGWILAHTVAAEVGDIGRFANPKKLAGYSGLCPRVYQSGGQDHRGSLAKNGPRYLRWSRAGRVGTGEDTSGGSVGLGYWPSTGGGSWSTARQAR